MALGLEAMLKTNVLYMCMLFIKITRVYKYFTPRLFTFIRKGDDFMDNINNATHLIVKLTDERNYLRNILEEADDLDLDLETVILNRIDRINNKIDELEK